MMPDNVCIGVSEGDQLHVRRRYFELHHAQKDLATTSAFPACRKDGVSRSPVEDPVFYWI